MSEDHDLIDIDHILVPVASRATAPQIVDFALGLISSDRGRITVLAVAPTSTEDIASEFGQISELVQQYQRDGHRVQMRTKLANSYTRAILDTAREKMVDLILLGLYRPEETGGISTDHVFDNIVAAASCDVVMFHPSSKGSFTHIKMPLLREEDQGVTQALAPSLKKRFRTPVEIMPAELVQSSDSLLPHLEDGDLVSISISDRSGWNAWMKSGWHGELIQDWDGPFTIIFLLSGEVKKPTYFEKLRHWLNPKIAPFEQSDLVTIQEDSGTFSLDFEVLIIISAVLASVGLLLNSNAVIIGAMLVAPLMAPLIAFATGMSIGDIHLSRRAILTLLAGLLGALFVSYLIGAITATSIITSEMASRGNPSYLDLIVALASGVIGGYAAGRKSISSAIAGVAIAAALMPPLCTVGLAMAFGDTTLASGAFLLFFTNIVSIALAAWAAFFWLGLRPRETDEQSKRQRQRTSNVLVLTFVAILVVLQIRQAASSTTGRIETVLQESFVQSELVDFDIRAEDPLQILATIRQPVERIDDRSEINRAEQNLEAELNEPVDLLVVLEPVVEASDDE
jgi:uncharacterized hydrophobic protein (TIGR00271 family)